MATDPDTRGSTPRTRRVTRSALVVGSIVIVGVLVALFLVPFISTAASGSASRYVNCTYCPA